MTVYTSTTVLIAYEATKSQTNNYLFKLLIHEYESS